MASVADGAVSAGTSTIAVVSIIAAACGGGFEGAGFTYPPLTPQSRTLLTIAGVALLVYEQIRSGHWHIPSRSIRGTSRVLPLILAGMSFVLLSWLVLTRNAIADPPPLSVSQKCPLVQDSPTPRSATTYWILEGFKEARDSDSLDQDRNIHEPCVARAGQIATIYRLTHVWQGIDPAKLDSSGRLSVKETNIVLVPGSIVHITGELSGPVVENGNLQLLYYNVWAPIAKPLSHSDDTAGGSSQ